MQQATLYLIPSFLSDGCFEAMPPYIKDISGRVRIWFVEELRSARRFLKAMNKDIVIDDLTFYLLNEHDQSSLSAARTLFQEGKEIGLLSDAGCPAVADPGSALVEIAHQCNAIVKPYVGPNSILLALMASGFNGQQFAFHGYLPNKQPALGKKILELELVSRQNNSSQFFIEAPYRNDQLIRELLKTCRPETRLCVAANLTSAEEKIISKPVGEWRKMDFSFHKQAAVFGIYSGF